MNCILSVRSVVFDPVDRPAFDAWYAQEHAAAFYRIFAPTRFWRCWSDEDPSVHYVFYEFDNKERLVEVMSDRRFTDLVEDFSNRWRGKVTRSRDIFTVCHTHPYES